MALAFPSSRSQHAEAAKSTSSAASTSASAVIERPTETCPYPRPDGYATDASPFASVDLSFSPDAIDTADSIDASQLRARIAEVSAAQEEGDAGGGGGDADAEKPAGMNASLKGMLLLNLGAALFGSNMVAIKAAEDSMSSTALSATRFGIAALAFAPYVWRGLKLPQVRRSAAELALWLFGGYTAQASGLEMTTAARGAFTGTFTVVAVPLLVGLSGRKVSWTTWVAAVTAIIGVGMLTSSGGDPTWGDALCIVSATLFGVHKYRSEIVTAQVEETTELIAVQLFGLAAASALVTAPEVISTLQEHGVAGTFNSVLGLPWPALFFMGLGTTALTLWIEMNALKEVSAPVAAIIYSAEPLWGAGLAWCLLDERWGPLGWAGAALIIASSLGAQLGGSGTEKAQKKPKDA